MRDNEFLAGLNLSNPKPKYQVFVSSTYEDLKEEREQVLKAILRLGHIPIGMEMFNAANQTQWELIKRRIEESDYYLVIIAHRYGSIDNKSGFSYTEKEYNYAKSLKIPVMGFVLDRAAHWPGNKHESDPKKQEALAKFIQKVQTKMRASWTNKHDLALTVTSALSEAMTAFPRTGWVRSDQAINVETVTEISRLHRENLELRERLDVVDNLHPRIFSYEEFVGIEENAKEEVWILRHEGPLEHDKFYEIVKSNIERGIAYRYFVRPKHSFEIELESLIKNWSCLEGVGKSPKDLISVQKTVLAELPGSFIIIDPLSRNARGFDRLESPLDGPPFWVERPPDQVKRYVSILNTANLQE